MDSVVDDGSVWGGCDVYEIGGDRIGVVRWWWVNEEVGDFFFFRRRTAYEMGVRLVGSGMCVRDRV